MRYPLRIFNQAYNLREEKTFKYQSISVRRRDILKASFFHSGKPIFTHGPPEKNALLVQHKDRNASLGRKFRLN